MNIQYTLKMMAMTAQEILSVLIESISRLGCGLGGIPYGE
jgi:hypothetical protein